jgi:hypothetical protein
MRNHRFHSLMLERLDDRVLPSGVGMAPTAHAAGAEHLAIHTEVHPMAKLKEAVHAKVVHDARVHHHRIVPAVHVSGGQASSISIAVGSPARGAAAASQAAVVGANGTGHAHASTMATAAIVASVPPTAQTGNTSVPSQAASTTGPGDIQNGPLAKAGQDLITIYEEFEQQGGGATFASSEAGLVEIVGTSVGVDVHSGGGDFAQLVSAMTALGMQVQAQDASHGVVEGLLPIGALLPAAQNSQTLSLSPIYVPQRN